MHERHVLGGRTFVPVRESTVEHDVTFLALARTAGLGEEMAPWDGETLDAYLQRVVLRVAGSGSLLPMLGCLLIPQDRVADKHRPGESWTPEIGEETARFLGSLTDERDKEVIWGLVPLLLFPFCEAGMRSFASSMTSSGATPGRNPNGRPPAATAPGKSSSASSPTATTTAPGA